MSAPSDCDMLHIGPLIYVLYRVSEHSIKAYRPTWDKRSSRFRFTKGELGVLDKEGMVVDILPAVLNWDAFIRVLLVFSNVSQISVALFATSFFLLASKAFSFNFIKKKLRCLVRSRVSFYEVIYVAQFGFLRDEMFNNVISVGVLFDKCALKSKSDLSKVKS